MSGLVQGNPREGWSFDYRAEAGPDAQLDGCSPTNPAPAVPSTALPCDTSDRASVIHSGGRFTEGQSVFGRYTVIRLLGVGGMGEVWQVRHNELNVDRALKLILSIFASVPQILARFRREARLMAAFDYPHSIRVNDAQLAETDMSYIDMEYVKGRSLDKILRPGIPMPLDWVARILSQICEVLQAAHDGIEVDGKRRPIIHRDLKPSNLMLLDGRPVGQEFVKVGDWGLGKIWGERRDSGDFISIPGAFMGTPPYTSPEQAEGEAIALSDIYSTGVILYEFLTGHRPFSGAAARMVMDTLQTPPPPFATINPEARVPAKVEAVVMRCLAKNPADRPQSARELAEGFLAAVRQ